ncbi:NAD(P)-dependent oxidoreductase [Cryptosporangium sp. NPDC048952]|uniref:NAD(P)-dependent oxidoreductase n=1 Tax=Cryptosporangium sp. NPDC048952 TaxID=3363961 RepID=UPI0037242E45
MVGAGRMGLPIVRALVRAGHDVRVADRRAEVAPAVRDAGAHWAPDDVLDGVEVLITVLPGSPEVRAVVPGLLERAAPGVAWIDLTSTAPDLGKELAEAARKRGLVALDAPMGGGPGAELTLYVGGDAAVLDAYRDLLGAFAGRIHHCGGPGAGYLTKLLVNVLWFGQAAAVTEALLIGQRAGLAPEALGELLNDGPAASAFLRDYLPALTSGDRLPSFGLDRIVEELESVQALAPYPVSGAVTALYRDALAHFGPVNGELLGAAYLEHLAGRRLTDPA